MPCFTAPINDNGQILVRALVTDAARGESEFAEMFAAADPKNLDAHGIKSCNALLDTGANKSGIAERLAESLELNIFGTGNAASISGIAAVNVYRVNIHIPFGGAAVKAGKEMYKVELSNWADAEVLGISGGKSYDVLLGIDFIRHGALHVSGGHFTFCI